MSKRNDRIKWLSRTRSKKQEEIDNKNFIRGRSSYLRDIGTLVHFVEFRKLSSITQVYINPHHRIRSRLTHSLEVENIGMQISRYFINKFIEKFNKKIFKYLKNKNTKLKDQFDLIQRIEDVTRGACLAHDIGHPPFAHTGEKFLKESKINKRIFDSNVNNLRILGGLTPTSNGKNFTYALIDASLKKKPSIPFYSPSFNSEEIKLIKKISKENNTIIDAEKLDKLLDKKLLKLFNDLFSYDSTKDNDIFLRHPIAYFMECSDDISYIAADIEDAISQNILSCKEIKKIFCEISLLNKNFKEHKNLRKIIDSNKIKSFLIRTFYEDIKLVIDDLVNYIIKNEKDGDIIKILNNFPLHFFKFVLEKSMPIFENKEKKIILKKEFGNLAYLGKYGIEIYNLKKNSQKFIFSTEKVVEMDVAN